MHKRKGAIEIVLVLLLVVAIGAAGYFYLSSGKENKVDLYPTPTTISTKEQILVDKKMECEEKGGEWEIAGTAFWPRCFIKTKDAGKECLGYADCEGICLAPEGAIQGEKTSGKCSEWDWLLGCNAGVDNGIVTPTLCAD